jgi:hypothetical protein
VPIYIRGSKKLDYVFASRRLQSLVRSCGINLFNELVFSDHFALFADFAMPPFLGTTLPQIVRSDLRFIASDGADVTKFMNKAYDHLDQNKAFHLFQDFLLDADTADKPWELANRIDTLLGHAFKCADKSCVKPRRAPWSLQLQKASRKLRFWKTALTQRCSGVSQSTVLVDIDAEVWENTVPSIPSNERASISVGRAAENALKRIQKNAKHERAAFLRFHRERLALRVTPKDTETADAIKTIDRQLTDTRMFGRIQFAVKPVSAAPLTKVELVDETPHIHPITRKAVTLRAVHGLETVRVAVVARVEAEEDLRKPKPRRR